MSISLISILVAQGCSAPVEPIEIREPRLSPGHAHFEIELGPFYVPGSLNLKLDGQAVAPNPPGEGYPRRVSVDVDARSGAHLLVAVAHFEEIEGLAVRLDTRDFVIPNTTPSLRSSWPALGAVAVPRDEWLDLEFEEPTPRDIGQLFALKCAGVARAVAAHVLSPRRVVINPADRLPPDARCELSWPTGDDREVLAFSTAHQGRPVEARYNRLRTRTLAPYPDDYFARDDEESPTGLRLELPVPARETDVRQLFSALLGEVNGLDGFSPLGPIAVEVSNSLDLASIPTESRQSLDPLASVGLFDLDPRSPDYGRRVPFRLEMRHDRTSLGLESHTLLVFPSIPLRPGGRYGVVLTRRARAAPARPLSPSRYFAAALERRLPRRQGRQPPHVRTRELLEPLLEVIEQVATPPIPRDDLALAFRFSVRSLDDLPADLLAVRAQVESAPPPDFEIESVQMDEGGGPESPVAAVVRGRWQAPDWRDGDNLARDEAGRPVMGPARPVPFVLALPRVALEGPVPLVLYQHGNPGGAEREVPREARRYLAAAGFAVIGFTDIANREVAPGSSRRSDADIVNAQVAALMFRLLGSGRIPDYWTETNAEQIAFLKLIGNLGELDVLPLSSPDGVAELDVAAPLGFVGVSQGANHAPALLPYAPEIRAAALVAGGSRLVEVLIHQQERAFLEDLPLLFPHLAPIDIWLGLALFQAAFDRQDGHNHAHFVYRDPLPVAGTLRKASVLLIAGLDDSLVPNHATDSLAYQLGPMPQLEPVPRDVHFLDRSRSSVSANIDHHTTAAYSQYVPAGVPGIPPSPGCADPAVPVGSRNEGHYCAQRSPASERQRVRFLRSAVSRPVPVITGPGAEGASLRSAEAP